MVDFEGDILDKILSDKHCRICVELKNVVPVRKTINVKNNEGQTRQKIFQICFDCLDQKLIRDALN